MAKIHDRGYTKLLSNKEIFRQLVTTFVHEEWVKDLDFSQCELLKDSFLSQKYKRTMSDLIYKVKLRGRDLYIVILLEFKSQPSRFVALQILGYVVDFWRHLIETEKKLRMLPPVFPIMLYNGEKPWASPVNISELIEGNELLGKYALNFKYFPIIENAFDKDELLKIGNIISTLFLTEAHYDLALLENQLLELFKKTEDKQAVSLFLNWLKQLSIHEKIEATDYQILERTYYDQEEVNMLINSIRKEKKQLRSDGMKEGRSMEKFEIAKTMLENNEPIEKIRQYTKLPYDTILKLKAELHKN